jgi:hypothetical protein
MTIKKKLQHFGSISKFSAPLCDKNSLRYPVLLYFLETYCLFYEAIAVADLLGPKIEEDLKGKKRCESLDYVYRNVPRENKVPIEN